MPQQIPMVLDTNVFIEPKNRYYPFDICPGFWEFLIADFKDGNAVSVLSVRDELLAQEDDLSDWVKDVVPKVHFIDCLKDQSVLENQLEVAEYVRDYYDKPNLIEDFLGDSVADSWVIAYAKAKNGIVVTHETHKSKGRKVSMSDVCDHFGIHHIDVFEFLRQEKAKFVYSPLQSNE